MTRTPRKDDVILEALIESELSASETYRCALETMSGHKHAAELRRIETEHRQAAGVLRERCRGGPAVASRGWAEWSGGTELGAATALDEGAAVVALKAGEEEEIREYEAALENPALGTACKRLIASLLLPQTRAHLLMLDRFVRR